MSTDSSGPDGLPQLPTRVWQQLRQQFRSSVPREISPTYIATILHVEEAAAKQYLGHLKQMGLVDNQNKPTQLAEDWRHDETYGEVCLKILNSSYPQELIEIAPPPTPDRDRVVKYIMRKFKLGEGAAKNKASQYMLLANGVAGPPKDNGGKSPRIANGQASPKRKAESRPVTTVVAQPARKEKPTELAPESPTKAEPHARRPVSVDTSASLHINVQIHISPESTPEQIEAIFKQMSIHLGLKNESH
jgi:hypothetical protein